MTGIARLGLAVGLLSALSLLGGVRPSAGERPEPLVLAQAPPAETPLTEEEKARRKERERQKGQPADPKKGPSGAPPDPKSQPPAAPPPPKKELPPVPKAQPPAPPPAAPPAVKKELPPTQPTTPPSGVQPPAKKEVPPAPKVQPSPQPTPEKKGAVQPLPPASGEPPIKKEPPKATPPSEKKAPGVPLLPAQPSDKSGATPKAEDPSKGPPSKGVEGDPTPKRLPGKREALPPAKSPDGSPKGPTGEPGPSPVPRVGQPPAPGAPGTPPPPAAGPLPKAPSGPSPDMQRIDQVQKGRKERIEDGGKRTVIEEPGNRVIIKQDNRTVIRHDETERFRRGSPDARSDKRPDGTTETVFNRPDGARVVTVVDANGRLLRRYRRDRDGREISIIDNRRFYRTGVGVAVGAVAIGVLLNLPPPVVALPRERYIVEYERASDDDLYEVLSAPPVERLERVYSLEEIRENYTLRDRMRRVDLDSITFDFGAWQVSSDQYPKLERIARIMETILRRDPDEVFLIEGHTDFIGSDVDNLSLSDRRAQSVAEILSDTFGVPPENLVTQGYGKQFLKIDTPEAERLNRRVAVRRITPLLSERLERR